MNDKARDKMRIPRTLAGSLGTGLLAVLMVGVVAFGASTIRPLTAGNADRQKAAEPTAAASAKPDAGSDEEPADKQLAFTGGDEQDLRPPKDEPAEEPSDKPDAEEPSDKPQTEPTDKPKPEPEPTDKPKQTEQPKPVSDHLELDAWTKEGHVKLAWSKYNGDGFAYYKVVRSKDATVSWPLGEDDQLVAAIADQWSPFAVDKPACGKELHYRVFAVRHGEDGYRVLAASGVAGAFVECAPPAEDPYVMGFDVWVTDAGAVKLAWEACGSEGFVAYKVVRSKVNEKPTYPLRDGDQLLAAIGDPHHTTFKDTDVASGQTWFYRVLSLGEGGVILGATPAKAITVE